jgi:hypothetical protein
MGREIGNVFMSAILKDAQNVTVFANSNIVCILRRVLGKTSLQDAFVTIDIFFEGFNTCLCLRVK